MAIEVHGTYRKNLWRAQFMTIGFKTQYFHGLAELEANNFWFRARNRLILWALHRYSPDVKFFLEIGCGTGFVLSAISKEFPNAMVFGSEYLEGGLEYARRRTPTAELSIMDARNIPYESKFDAVGCFDVLEHITEDTVVLQQIGKALRPGGFVFMTVPQHRWLWSAIDEYACHVRRYDAADLTQKVRRAGLEIVRSTSFVSTLLPAMYLSRVFQRNRVDMVTSDIAGLRINPVLNRLFEGVLNLELGLIRIGISLPFGGSRLLVARKPMSLPKGL